MSAQLSTATASGMKIWCDGRSQCANKSWWRWAASREASTHTPNPSVSSAVSVSLPVLPYGISVSSLVVDMPLPDSGSCWSDPDFLALPQSCPIALDLLKDCWAVSDLADPHETRSCLWPVNWPVSLTTDVLHQREPSWRPRLLADLAAISVPAQLRLWDGICLMRPLPCQPCGHTELLRRPPACWCLRCSWKFIKPDHSVTFLIVKSTGYNLFIKKCSNTCSVS